MSWALAQTMARKAPKRLYAAPPRQSARVDLLSGQCRIDPLGDERIVLGASRHRAQPLAPNASGHTPPVPAGNPVPGAPKHDELTVVGPGRVAVPQARHPGEEPRARRGLRRRGRSARGAPAGWALWRCSFRASQATRSPRWR